MEQQVVGGRVQKVLNVKDVSHAALKGNNSKYQRSLLEICRWTVNIFDDRCVFTE